MTKFTSVLLGSFVIGLGVGWLAGLSISPVISIIITSVVGVVAAVVSALSGVPDPAVGGAAPTPLNRWKVSPWPLACLLIGLLLGSGFGIWMRSHNSLGVNTWTESASDLTSEIQRWTDAGIITETVVSRLFDRRYPEGGTEDTTTAPTPGFTNTILFDNPDSPTECGHLRGTATDSLSDEMAQSEVEEFRYLSVVTDTATLREVVDSLCKSIGQ